MRILVLSLRSTPNGPGTRSTPNGPGTRSTPKVSCRAVAHRALRGHLAVQSTRQVQALQHELQGGRGQLAGLAVDAQRAEHACKARYAPDLSQYLRRRHDIAGHHNRALVEAGQQRAEVDADHVRPEDLQLGAVQQARQDLELAPFFVGLELDLADAGL